MVTQIQAPPMPHGMGGIVLSENSQKVLSLRFLRKGPDGRFRPIAGCTANCHVTCAGLAAPPCGRPELAERRPYRPSVLR